MAGPSERPEERPWEHLAAGPSERLEERPSEHREAAPSELRRAEDRSRRRQAARRKDRLDHPSHRDRRPWCHRAGSRHLAAGTRERDWREEAPRAAFRPEACLLQVAA